MIETTLHLRAVENKDWATLLFVLSFATIAIAKSAYEGRFTDFVKLIYSDKYTNLYKDSGDVSSGFTISLFFIQVISLAFFLLIAFATFGYASKTDWMLFTQIATFLNFFILAKFLLEKIIATAFSIEEFVDHFNFQKATFRNYIGLILLPITTILFYSDVISKNILVAIGAILLISNLLTYLTSIKNYQNLILSKLFYFILYLCTLEIAPYYFMYYWFTKGKA